MPWAAAWPSAPRASFPEEPPRAVKISESVAGRGLGSRA